MSQICEFSDVSPGEHGVEDLARWDFYNGWRRVGTDECDLDMAGE